MAARDGHVRDGSSELRFPSFDLPAPHYAEDDLRLTAPRPFLWPDVFEIGRRQNLRPILPLVDNWRRRGGVRDYAAFPGKPRGAFWRDRELVADLESAGRHVLGSGSRLAGVGCRADRDILVRETGSELGSSALFGSSAGEISFMSNPPGAFREGAEGLGGGTGARVAYRLDGPLPGARVTASRESVRGRLEIRASADGTRFLPMETRAESAATGDTATYGSPMPVAYRLEHGPPGLGFVEIGLAEGVRLAHRELEYGEGAMDPSDLRQAVATELRSNLLPFWREHGVDAAGHFVAQMSHTGSVDATAPRGLILATRLLWAFSAAYCALGDPGDLARARQAYADLEDSFRDPDHGGFRWRVDAAGAPLERDKKTYGQAFAIYALTEFHRASGETAPLEEAQRLFDLVERHAHDTSHGGYLEACGPDWSPTARLQLTEGDMLAPKSMNAHLHLLEAYTSLYRVWPDPGLAARLHELLALFTHHIASRGPSGTARLHHFFDRDWNVLSTNSTFGHDIEAAWLLREAATAIGEPRVQAVVEDLTLALARGALIAVDGDGGLAYEARNGRVVNGTRDWWCQAEAVVGFWDTFQRTGDLAFANAATRVWSFIERRVSDHSSGEWHWRVRADGTVDASLPRISEWKGPYHTVRACLEMMRRLDAGRKHAAAPVS